MAIDDYGYGEGLLSNSMVQTAQFCTYKFKKLYVEKYKPPGKPVIAATTLGSLAHKALEDMPHRERVLETFYREASDYLGIAAEDIRSILQRTHIAIEAVMAYGRQQGRDYVAPTMTNYWKTHYGGIEMLWAEIEARLGGYFNCQITIQDFLTGAYTAIQNELNKPSFAEEDWEKVHRERQLVGKVFGYNMVGAMDIILENPSEVRLLDYKTGRKVWEDGDIRNADQFCLYTELLEQNGLGAPRDLVVGVRDLKHNKLLSVSPSSESMTRWADRYERKLEVAQEAMEGGPDVNIPFGSGFHPGCPCELAPICPYVVQ